MLWIYLAIDPGASGGVAILKSKDSKVDVRAFKMPETEADLLFLVQQQGTLEGKSKAVIEQVGGFVGGKGNPGSAMFKFGQNYGACRMAIIASGIPLETVTPQRWQKGLGIPKKKLNESKTQWKNRLKAKAQQLFPNCKITLKTADAVLLAEYYRRKFEGGLL